MKERYTKYQLLFEVGVAFQFEKFNISNETFKKRGKEC